MAYQDSDGFDHYSTASLRWTVSGTAPTIGTAYRRFAPPAGLPGQGLSLSGGSYLYRPLASNQPTLIGKVAYLFQALPGSTAGIMGFDAGVANTLSALVVSSAGALEFWTQYQAAYAVLQLSTGPGVLAPATYYGIEWQIFFSNTGTGTLQVWVNGVQVINATGLTTAAGGYAYGARVQLGSNQGAGTYAYFDDYRVWDATGSTQNAPAGTDSRIYTKLPSGAGATANFTPNGAAANWQCVDDNPPPGGTTYVSGASSGLIDAYAMPSAGFSAFTAAPLMVVARSYVAQTGGHTVKIGVDSSGVQGYGASMTPGSGYGFTDACIPNDPNTRAPWAAAAADAAQHCKQQTA